MCGCGRLNRNLFFKGDTMKTAPQKSEIVILSQAETPPDAVSRDLVENPTVMLAVALFSVFVLIYGLCAGFRYFFKPYDKENPNEPTIF